MDLITTDRLNEYHTSAVKPVVDKFYPDDSLLSVNMITGEVVIDNGDGTTTTKRIIFE